ncbi:shikimate dehydrogenase [Piscinibacter terrae]|uniref:Shikimate dehydrogenase (NADP(+)) n=1 Tax=Piscinibacter terrae TaxID=2496871 RepID=A0A3N7JZP3_9BURK|nr:shikimate dehydrogenase [Albitalea terrae]RQP26249.1 shikimate dehydrogenase [Albitalea terrae]
MNDKLLIGLIGAGIQRSLTPALHEEEARRHGLRLHYQLIDLDTTGSSADDLPALLGAVRTIGFAGLNVTYPCKQAILPLLDELSDEARALGAVNTVVRRGSRLIGHNTDGSGWAWGFRRALPSARLDRVVQLGAGGAGAAVADASLRMGASELVVVDREPERAQALADRLNANHDGQRAQVSTDLEAALQGASGLVHCTPTGMDKLPGMPLPASLLRPSLWVSEIVYFPLDTALLRAARAAGCPTADGGGMAVGQAVGAFRLFTGREPDAVRMEQHFRELITHRAPALQAAA